MHTEDVLHLDEARWSHSQIEQDTFSHSEEDGLHRTHKRHPNGVHSRKGQTKTKKTTTAALPAVAHHRPMKPHNSSNPSHNPHHYIMASFLFISQIWPFCVVVPENKVGIINTQIYIRLRPETVFGCCCWLWKLCKVRLDDSHYTITIIITIATTTTININITTKNRKSPNPSGIGGKLCYINIAYTCQFLTDSPRKAYRPNWLLTYYTATNSNSSHHLSVFY